MEVYVVKNPTCFSRWSVSCIEVNKSSDYGTKNFTKTLITPKGQVWLTNKLQEYVDDFFNDSKE